VSVQALDVLFVRHALEDFCQVGPESTCWKGCVFVARSHVAACNLFISCGLFPDGFDAVTVSFLGHYLVSRTRMSNSHDPSLKVRHGDRGEWAPANVGVSFDFSAFA